MQISDVILIIGGVLGGLLLIALIVLFFVSRRSQRVMKSVLDLLTRPERARVNDAVRVFNALIADEMIKMESNFQNVRETLNAQIATAAELKNNLDAQNAQLVATTDDAVKKMATMAQRLENTVDGLKNIVNSNGWHDVELATDKFSASVTDMLDKIDATTNDATERTARIHDCMTQWIENGNTLSEKLQNEFNSNTEQMQTLSAECENMQQKLSELSATTASGFESVKTAADGYSETMDNNNKRLDEHLNKLDTFGKQAKKQLTGQVNTLTNTANVVAGQVRLSEASVESQVHKLTDAVESLMGAATSTEAAVRNISRELTELCNHFNFYKRYCGRIKDCVGCCKFDVGKHQNRGGGVFRICACDGDGRARNFNRNEYRAYAIVGTIGKSDKNVGGNDGTVTAFVGTDRKVFCRPARFGA